MPVTEECVPEARLPRIVLYMTLATARRYALVISAAAGIVAAVMAAALISAVVSRPEQVVAAMGDQDIRALLGLITDGVFAAVREIARYL